MSHKGIFTPRNPAKYMGDPTNIVFRSSWELVAMMRLDKDPNVIGWSSEETIVPYRNPITDKIYRYFPDFIVKRKMPDGKIKTYMIEVKPESEVYAPTGKKTKRYKEALLTYAKNTAKWEAAKKYCEERGFQFVIETEYSLGIAKRKTPKS